MRPLIFDFDGTIADSFETLLAIFEEIAARPKRLTPHEIRQLRGAPLKDIIKYLKIKRWRIPRLVLKAKRLVALRILDIKPSQGIAEALKQLHAAGHPMFVMSTNSPENINRFLTKYNLDGYFTSIYGDIGLRGKASALKKIIRQEKLQRADCVYIGDEVRDIEAAKKAGITSMGVTWGFNNATAIEEAAPAVIARSPKDLFKLL